MSNKYLDILIEQYAVGKESLDTLQKNVDCDKSEIKKELEKEGLDEYSTKEYTVTRTEINRDKLNEDMLISVLHEILPEELLNKVIRKVEVLDLDKLEDLVYNRVIKADVVNNCVEHKTPTVRLNLKENKNAS